jgi:hypothetical protein
MGVIIEDGKGTGYKAAIDNENFLQTKAVTETLLSHSSHRNQSAFGISTPMRTLTITGGRILFIKNLSLLNFHITDFWFNWNGGSNNFNRPCYGELIFGDTQPDTNITTGGAGNLNLSSVNTIDLTVLYWDEIGDGMTGHTDGTTAFYWVFCKNPAFYHTDGAIILSTNKTLSINLRGHEVGEGSINILGFVSTE